MKMLTYTISVCDSALDLEFLMVHGHSRPIKEVYVQELGLFINEETVFMGCEATAMQRVPADAKERELTQGEEQILRQLRGAYVRRKLFEDKAREKFLI
jgi:hypothetical protein